MADLGTYRSCLHMKMRGARISSSRLTSGRIPGAQSMSCPPYRPPRRPVLRDHSRAMGTRGWGSDEPLGVSVLNIHCSCGPKPLMGHDTLRNSVNIDSSDSLRLDVVI